MRILIIGCIAFVIWCFVSAWLYNDHLLPALKKPAAVVTVEDTGTSEADSLMKLKAMMPEDLMIYFEFNDTKFKPDPQTDSRVAEFKAWLDKYPGSMLSVTGHTDLVGTPDYNQALGLKRAEIVGKYLENQGVDAGKILTESLGESKPVAGYLTKEERAKNRRTEITIKMQ
jgi:OOP family OmpA-OmpF porin